MGQNTSREKRHQHFKPTPITQKYENNTRTYAALDHRRILVSNSIHHTSTRELQNLHKPNQLIPSSLPPASIQQPILLSTPQVHSSSRRKKLRSDGAIPRQALGLKKSRSAETLPNLYNIVTPQDLLYNQSKRRQRNRSPSSQISTHSSKSGIIQKSTSTSTINKPSTTNSETKKIPRDLQLVLIDPKELQNPREIGQGNFGTVYHAIYKNTRNVAIKALKPQDGYSFESTAHDYDENMYKLLDEAHIMTRLKHANVLCIIGVTFFGDKQQLSLVTDYMKKGSLLNYLRNNKEKFLKSDSRIITMKLNSFGRQIFEAMLYLEERKIIHRDLAARNCLIGEGDILKVGDFGLTKLTDCGLYKSTNSSKFAPRWTAPEAQLSAKFSSRSDVWSYGITLWEIYTLGDRPFGNGSNVAFQLILKNLSDNISQYLPKPQQFGSDETYTHIILPCLTYNVAMRPRFRDLRERLITILY